MPRLSPQDTPPACGFAIPRTPPCGERYRILYDCDFSGIVGYPMCQSVVGISKDGLRRVKQSLGVQSPGNDSCLSDTLYCKKVLEIVSRGNRKSISVVPRGFEQVSVVQPLKDIGLGLGLSWQIGWHSFWWPKSLLRIH